MPGRNRKASPIVTATNTTVPPTSVESVARPMRRVTSAAGNEDSRDSGRAYARAITTREAALRTSVASRRAPATESETGSVSPIRPAASGGAWAARTVLSDARSNSWVANSTTNRTPPVRVRARLNPSVTALASWRAIDRRVVALAVKL
jgi:hypothetical protein